ncbi:chalcone isomerase family protein [Halomonas sp. SSL-5]|uniref:chalcone isomerase family protein n=1 Tax=Halomonas sp. SSL-5 TaxID=3065855 RepID=UPI00273882CE|nr:chalcone isomerase family protein [Halomonas sp. SSL-5]MDY7116229.1 chalcone isomerase family protein [Halomonas sp. SSL-5]
MRLFPLIPLLMILLLAPAASAQASEPVEVNGARFAGELETQDQAFRLVGHGLFRYMIWDAYAGAYYQAPGASTPAPLEEIPRRLELEYFHAIAADDFAGVTRDRVREARGESAYRELLPSLNAFTRAYRSVEPGDRYALTWSGDGLSLALNGETLYRGDDPELANALFAIWLGDSPLKEAFRDALLGRR